ncbi:toxin-antitoxin system YwqK family antitoxin [Clostridium sp.]|uniref:toxin-antitoxin system YwqK family antitoxin n=1 Tax=Clostridium sp. TaxID=1506 RepID=UPI002618ECC8|nr:hypothetical protein [uncultured Clostridium sp.]
MENDILDKKYVIENGIDFDNLWGEYCSDRILDNPADEGGNPFTGLSYELYNNGQLIYYSFYREGFPNGDYANFYKNNNIKSRQYMEYGRITGKKEVWFENGNLKSVGEYELSFCLKLKEWDCEGKLIKEQLAPTEEDINSLKRERAWSKRIGRH